MTGKKKKRRLDRGSAMAYALSLLSYRDRSEEEIRERLSRRGYPADAIAHVVSELKSINYLDDKKFAQTWLSWRKGARPAGREKIRWELLAKGLKDDVVIEALEEGYPPEEEAEAARALAEKRAAQEGSTRKRVYDYLRRRGFPHDVAMNALESVESDGAE